MKYTNFLVYNQCLNTTIMFKYHTHFSFVEMFVLLVYIGIGRRSVEYHCCYSELKGRKDVPN